MIFPPDYPAVPDGEPVVFLAGPIQGAADWQAKAAAELKRRIPGVIIASPRRDYLDGTFDYAAQVDWETHWLARAGRRGVILFHLAAEAEHDCGRAYAQTTRFELAEWTARHRYESARLVVSIEDGFSGARYIRHRLGQGCPGIPIFEGLLQACQEVERMLVDDIIFQSDCIDGHGRHSKLVVTRTQIRAIEYANGGSWPREDIERVVDVTPEELLELATDDLDAARDGVRRAGRALPDGSRPEVDMVRFSRSQSGPKNRNYAYQWVRLFEGFADGPIGARLTEPEYHRLRRALAAADRPVFAAEEADTFSLFGAH